ncbi:deoxyadenosine kinase [Kosmotoga arenicorallina S304]|uniref:Deoxyadenosine kinase n=1 Tax=Kosmotoga arenicorallina S304 TaxID=1453497 RepID=A0A176K1X7_9BACT|nr:deoxynucleoside kinase [Kosmotoga arenicorallina]OAA31196.1 deoxyadenosine kinase [Kosmotoga arenicorallina S304]
MMLSKLTGKYIAVEGVIGVGKTTLVRFLSRRYFLPTVLEVVEENPFLGKFYEDMDRWAFQTQLFFLLSRFDQQNDLARKLKEGAGIVSDYIFEKDHLFASLTLKDEQKMLYERIFGLLKEQVPKPDLVIYLYASVDVLMSRITLRDRPFERSMDRSYIELLADTYEAFFEKFTNTPVLRIDTTNIDFVKNEHDLNFIFELIEGRFQS